MAAPRPVTGFGSIALNRSSKAGQPGPDSHCRDLHPSVVAACRASRPGLGRGRAGPSGPPPGYPSGPPPESIGYPSGFSVRASSRSAVGLLPICPGLLIYRVLLLTYRVLLFRCSAHSHVRRSLRPPSEHAARLRRHASMRVLCPAEPKSGNGLEVDCIRPIIEGTAPPSRTSRPLPGVDPRIVAACATQHAKRGSDHAGTPGPNGQSRPADLPGGSPPPAPEAPPTTLPQPSPANPSVQSNPNPPSSGGVIETEFRSGDLRPMVFYKSARC